jgi:translation initiation factor 2 beta subunit (eIF-2beta)/eIF-5
MNGKRTYVTFGSKKIENEFEVLKKGKFEDKKLYEFIERVIKDLKANPICGTKIPKKLWPKEYIRKFGITNL